MQLPEDDLKKSKHVGAISNVLMQKFYVFAFVGVLIECLYEMHGATMKIIRDYVIDVHIWSQNYKV